MEYRTYGELKTKVQQETDTETEDFVSESELIEWFNDAINEAEAHIHTIGLEDDYFLTRQLYDLSVGQKAIVMPTNIYASKIRAFLYVRSTEVYEIRRLRGRDKFAIADEIDTFGTSTLPYRYMIFNDSAATKPYIELYPASNETRTDIIRMTYIRNANKVVDDTSIIDIPEFYYFLHSYVKYKIFNKEGSVLAEDSKMDLIESRKLMVETLENMVPDMDNKIEGDYTTYEEMS